MTGLRRLVLVVVFQVAIVLGLIIGVAYLISREIGIFGALGISFALVFAFQVQLHLHEPAPVGARSPLERPVGKPFGRFQVLHERLRWGSTSSSHFEAGVRPIIVELTDDRLLRHHGIVRACHPDAADAILDPLLADFLAGPNGSDPPTVAELSIVVGKLEEL